MGAAGTIQDTVNANQGNLDEQAGQIRGFLPGLGEMAFGENAGLNAASGYAQDVLGGKYLGSGNEYLNNMVSMTKGHVGDDINTMFSKAGRVGGDSHYSDLAKGLGEAELGLRYQDYGNERNAMTQAAGMMPSLTSAQYAGVMPYLAAQQTAGSLPYAGIGQLGQMGSLFGGYGQQTQSGGGGGMGSALASGFASALPFMLAGSDQRLKKNIRPLRVEADGLPIHEWEYREGFGLPTGRFVGPMAQDVAKYRPHDLGPLVNGYMTINASMISEAA